MGGEGGRERESASVRVGWGEGGRERERECLSQGRLGEGGRERESASVRVGWGREGERERVPQSG